MKRRDFELLCDSALDGIFKIYDVTEDSLDIPQAVKEGIQLALGRTAYCIHLLHEFRNEDLPYAERESIMKGEGLKLTRTLKELQ